jgi:uncharacterized glyoxalase superfamily protein PhnB
MMYPVSIEHAIRSTPMSDEQEPNTTLPTAVNIRDRTTIQRVHQVAAERGITEMTRAAEQLIAERYAELHTGQFIPGPAPMPEVA